MQPDYLPTQLEGVTDLTVLAPIKEGFVQGIFETCTYVERLKRLLLTLNALRLAARESAMHTSPFADFVGRLGIVHFFRFTIVPPDKGSSTYKLLLNVTFDGGWDPYIRAIWRDLGTMLDVICCNCLDYPLAHTTSFEEYVKWVRDNEIPGRFFYADSDMTVGDQRYYAQLEALQRRNGDANAADVEAATFTIDPPGATSSKAGEVSPQKQMLAVQAGLRVVSAFHRLAGLHSGSKDSGDAGVLLRFIHDLLGEFRGLVKEREIFKQPPFKPLQQQFEQQLKWFDTDAAPRATPAERLADEPEKLAGKVQAGIVSAYPTLTHGCLVLLRVKPDQVAAAVDFLQQWPTTGGDQAPGDGIYRNLAFTFEGLRTLGVAKQRLARFPEEFYEGMESRAGVIGDFHSNHPEQWNRPLRNWPPLPAGAAASVVELSMVHLAIQMRTGNDSASHELLPLFEEEIRKLEAGGLQVLHVQAMRSYIDASKGSPREHFGFLDGLSQPIIDAAAANRNVVPRGEILLGYGNNRGGPFPPQADLLMDNGSFLVVRKLRQRTDIFNAALTNAATTPQALEQLKWKMMGRTTEGAPLADPACTDNSFNFNDDKQGKLCPFDAHIRRANPRDRQVPRIMRRGMSYGPRATAEADTEDRGLMFMAYGASIAEQFEVIQRWLSGGNSTGLSSRQRDPFLGVPEPGETRIFRYMDEGKVTRVDLGDKPFVHLEWGLYLFAPSIEALRQLASLTAAQTANTNVDQDASPSSAIDMETWRRTLEDKDLRESGWKTVREQHGGVLDTEYGMLIGNNSQALEVFRDDGRKYSVTGYGERFGNSIGNGFLGQDLADPERSHAFAVNAAIAEISEPQAFDVARSVAATVLKNFLDRSQQLLGKRECSVDISIFSDYVLAALCTQWFGLPAAAFIKTDGRSDDPEAAARCPGHFYSVGRYVFSPHPSPTVIKLGEKQGETLRQAGLDYVKTAPLPKNSLAEHIAKAVRDGGGDEEFIARTLIGVMQGFPPAVDGNLRTALATWLTDKQLWNLQLDLMNGAPMSYEHAAAVLRKPLIASMRAHPVPDLLWRTTMERCPLADKEIPPGKKVVLSILSAMQDGADDALLFGRAPDLQGQPTTHGCPGRNMAMGVMLGAICGLLEAGTLRPTGSPATVNLSASTRSEIAT